VTPFGKYHLYEPLGEGGMAVVWRAKLHGPGGFEKALVVKQIRQELAARPEFVDLFVAEAKTTVSLTHANIVPVYELGMVDGTYFLALELVDGPPLATVIAGGPMPAPLAAYVVEQVLRGLEYAHRRGVVHRDLSSMNVLVSRDGEVKIVDFGIAAPVDARGVHGGSSGYIAPEQAAGAPADARADLYAAGVLLWELCSGRRYDGTPLDRGGPPRLAAVVTRACAADPAARFADAAAMLAALTRTLRDFTNGPTQAELSAFVRRRCPDVPRAAPARDDDDEAPPERPPGPSTAPVARQVTFATRVAPRPARRRPVAVAAAALALAGLGALAARGRSARAPEPAAPPGITVPASSPPIAPAPAPTPEEAPSAERPHRPARRGELTLGALPWAHVTIDGEKRADTPLVRLSLPAGPHAVRLVCPPTGRELKFTVTVEANREVRRVADLRGEPRLVDD
jgi:hypothetical protein